MSCRGARSPINQKTGMLFTPGPQRNWSAARGSRLYELNVPDRKPARLGRAQAGGLHAIDGGKKA